MKKPVLIIMARAPRFGAVKTRLAKDIGPLNAWRFYRNTLRTTSQRLGRDPRWHTWLQITPDRDLTPYQQWPDSYGLMTQGRGDIGRRMERGLTAFPRGVPVVLIGSDIPGVTADHIQRAFQALNASDVVFGPATDGGYWLVGFANRRGVRQPFANVRWSSAHALKDSGGNFTGRRMALIDELSDVDHGVEYSRLYLNHNQLP